MASDFHRIRVSAAFFRAEQIQCAEERREALKQLSLRLTGIAERAAQRDDAHLKAFAKQNGGRRRSDNPFTERNQMLAQNNLIIGKIMDTAKQASIMADAGLKPFIPA